MLTVRFYMPTEWIGVEYEEEVEFDEFDSVNSESVDEIECAFKDWLDETLSELRMSAEWEVL